jgi:hypothetical protein
VVEEKKIKKKERNPNIPRTLRRKEKRERNPNIPRTLRWKKKRETQTFQGLCGEETGGG